MINPIQQNISFKGTPAANGATPAASARADYRKAVSEVSKIRNEVDSLAQASFKNGQKINTVV